MYSYTAGFGEGSTHGAPNSAHGRRHFSVGSQKAGQWGLSSLLLRRHLKTRVSSSAGKYRRQLVIMCSC